MKFIYTICFLVAAAMIIFLGNKLIQVSLVQIQNKRTSFLKTIFLSSLILTLFFIQFCLLTQTAFPFLILLLLIAATLVGLLMNEIIGAIAGVSIRETRHKVNVMYTAMAFQQSLNAPSKIWVMIVAAIFLYGSWFAALWAFWSNPLGHPNVYIWAAVFIFIIPQITNIINNLNTLAPIVSSEYIDDDLRNASLTSNFSTIISSTIYFIFPFFVLNSTPSDTFSWLPPYWAIILIPLVSFVLFGIIPFFIGVYKFKNQKKYFLEWQQNWLHEFRNSILFPNEEKREINMHELEDEIMARNSENKMYGFLKELKEDTSKSKRTQSEQVIFILNDNKEEIIKWDLQMSFIQELEETKKNIENAKNTDEVKNHIGTRLDEIKNDLDKLEKSKNKMAGILTSLITGIIGVLLKTYQSDLLELLEKFRPH